ncbi:MAG: hypothetical protein PHE29_09930 [Tissierellia bacterium]|nr:hypothetical protein [Tissierellia bacterium]
MKKSFTLLVVFLLLCSCNKDNSLDNPNNDANIFGTQIFLSSVSYLAGIQTKSGELSADEVKELIAPMFQPSIDYLTLNGYDYSEDFETGDPNIILTALALLEYDLCLKNENSQTKSQFWDIVSCVFIGEGVRNLVDKGTGTMFIAKRFARKLLVRAIPYVGTAIGVISAGDCIYDLYS